MSGKRHLHFEEMVITEYDCKGPQWVGTLGWDSRTGQLWGTLAGQIRSKAESAERDGYVHVPGPVPSSPRYPITDALHKADQLAAIISSFGYFVPKEIERFYHPPKVRVSFRKSQLKRMRARGQEILY